MRSRPASSLAVGGVAGGGTWTWAEPVDATVSTLSGRFSFLTGGFKATDSTDALAEGADALKAGIAASTATAGGVSVARVLALGKTATADGVTSGRSSGPGIAV